MIVLIVQFASKATQPAAALAEARSLSLCHFVSMRSAVAPALLLARTFGQKQLVLVD